MNHRVDVFLDNLERIASAHPDEVADCLQNVTWLRSGTAEEISLLLQGVLDRSPPSHSGQDRMLQMAFWHLISRQRGWGDDPLPLVLDDTLVSLIAAVYRHLEAASLAREHLPMLLSGARTPRALLELADLMVDDPPRDGALVATALSPLFQHDDYDPRLLFPRLLQALSHVPAAAAVMDLANFLTRKGRLPQHPAAEHVQAMGEFLGGLAGRLGQLESSPPQGAVEIQRRGQQINEGVSLAVALCHALALIGDRSVVGKVYQAAELTHRRLRAEAAAALAQLGEKAGREMLVALASEPSVRLRVLAYADELDMLDQVDAGFRTAEARAEAELVLWLSQPPQLGVPPTSCEWLESRTLYWPGYDEPVDCFLFRFSYDLGELRFSNVGLAGPATYAFAADLSDLPPDDIFAAFAGWSADHEEMYEFEVGGAHTAEEAEVARLTRRLRDAGFERIEPLKLCLFFGDRVLVAHAHREGKPGVAVADLSEIAWLPRIASTRPPGPDEAYCIYKGRRLLRSFNE